MGVILATALGGSVFSVAPALSQVSGTTTINFRLDPMVVLYFQNAASKTLRRSIPTPVARRMIMAPAGTNSTTDPNNVWAVRSFGSEQAHVSVTISTNNGCNAPLDSFMFIQE